MNCCTHQCNEGHDCPVRSTRLDGTPLPLHRQVLPPEPDSDGYTAGCWWAYGIAGAVFILFVVMNWVVYPNFPQ